MDGRKFRIWFVRCFVSSALLLAYLIDTAHTSGQATVNIVIAVLLLAICFLVAGVAATPHQKRNVRGTYRGRPMTLVQKQNAAMFNHYPRSADFRVRAYASKRKG